MDYYAGQDTFLSPAPFPGTLPHSPQDVSKARMAKTVVAGSLRQFVEAKVTGPEQTPRPVVYPLERRFSRLAAKWKTETQFMSAIDDMAMNEHYQKIMSMGPQVVPLLLRRLKAKPDFWFWALHHITGASPVKKSDRGNLQKMTNAWLRWARNNGYSV